MKNMFDESLRHDYPLTPESVVFDVGGFKGEWSRIMFEKYGCKIHCFEPVFPIKNSNISVYNFGLGSKTKTIEVKIDGDKTGQFCRSGIPRQIDIVDICDFIDLYNIEFIDLLKLNIEGMEYELITRLISSGYINKVKYLQVQFHNISPTSDRDMYLLQEELKKTHTAQWQFRYIWESWERNDNNKG